MPIDFRLLGDIPKVDTPQIGSSILGGMITAQQMEAKSQEMKQKQQELQLKVMDTLTKAKKADSDVELNKAKTANELLKTQQMPLQNQMKLMELNTRMQQERVQTQKALNDIKMQPMEMATKQLDYINKHNDIVSSAAWGFGTMDQTKQANVYPQFVKEMSGLGITLPSVWGGSAKTEIGYLAAISKERSDLIKTAINEKGGTPFSTIDPSTGQIVSSARPENKANAAASQKWNELEIKDWFKYKETLRPEVDASHNILDDISRAEYIMKSHGMDITGQIRGHFTPYTSKEASEIDSILNEIVLNRIGQFKGIMSRATNMSLGMLQKSKVNITQDPQAAANRMTFLKAVAQVTTDLGDDLLPTAEAHGIKSTSKFLAISNEIKSRNPVFINGKINLGAIGAWRSYDLDKLSQNMDKGIRVEGIDRDFTLINGVKHMRSEWINQFIKLNPNANYTDAVKMWLETAR